MKPVLSAILATLIGLSAPLAAAQDLTPVKRAELSARLYGTGLASGDALLILAAAKLRKSIDPTPVLRLAEGADAAGAAAGEEAPIGWQEMLDAALPLAEGDDTLLGLIDDIRAEGTKGVASGPVYNIGKLGNGGQDAYPPIAFRGGEYAEVYVEAKSATNLNLTITDAQGRLVCSDTDVSHIAYCGWTPDQAGNFVLRVENKGPSGAAYALMTN